MGHGRHCRRCIDKLVVLLLDLLHGKGSLWMLVWWSRRRVRWRWNGWFDRPSRRNGISRHGWSLLSMMDRIFSFADDTIVALSLSNLIDDTSLLKRHPAQGWSMFVNSC